MTENQYKEINSIEGIREGWTAEAMKKRILRLSPIIDDSPYLYAGLKEINIDFKHK